MVAVAVASLCWCLTYDLLETAGSCIIRLLELSSYLRSNSV